MDIDTRLAFLETHCARGWAVFPCKEDKTPATKSGVYAGSTDIVRWRGLFRQKPHWNIGVWTGGSNLVVIDCDVPKDPDDPDQRFGLGVFIELCDKVLKIDPFETYYVVTPSGGYHFYYEYDSSYESENDYLPPGTDVLGKRVDVRSYGSYVLTAGSEVESLPYMHVAGEVQPLPEALKKALMPKHAARNPMESARLRGQDQALYDQHEGVKWLSLMCEDIKNAPEGTRNSTFANKMWRVTQLHDWSMQDVEILSDAARQVGLDEREINACVKTALRKAV